MELLSDIKTKFSIEEIREMVERSETMAKIVSRSYFRENGHNYSWTVWDDGFFHIDNEDVCMSVPDKGDENKYAKMAKQIKEIAEKYKGQVIWLSRQEPKRTKL